MTALFQRGVKLGDMIRIYTKGTLYIPLSTNLNYKKKHTNLVAETTIIHGQSMEEMTFYLCTLMSLPLLCEKNLFY